MPSAKKNRSPLQLHHQEQRRQENISKHKEAASFNEETKIDCNKVASEIVIEAVI